MRKFIVIGILFIFCACEKNMVDDFIIVNDCSEEILVTITNFSDKTENIKIAPKTDSLVLDVGGVMGPRNSDMIKSNFKRIDVTKNGISSKKDYLNKSHWTCDIVNNRYNRWYLTIEPKDFE